MTDYENLMDEFAESQKLTFSERHKARSALQSAIEALQKEVSTLDVLLEECKMDWSGDVTQIKAEHKREIEALQSQLDDAIRSLANWQHQFTELQAENERLAHANNALKLAVSGMQAKLDAVGKVEPVAWQFRTNGKHWHVVQVCPPDDTYDKGTLSPLYAAPKALAPSREVIGRYMADKGFYLSKEALDGLMLKLEGIGGTP